MKILCEYMELAEDITIEKELQELTEGYADQLSQWLTSRKGNNKPATVDANNNTSKVTEFPEEELNHKMGEALKRIEAAYRGLGLTNKLTNPEDKKKNRGRIMGNINRLRAVLNRVHDLLSAENKAVLGGVTEAVYTHDKDGDNDITQDDVKELRKRIVKAGGNPLDTRFHKAIKSIKKKLVKSDVSESWDTDYETTDSKKGMFDGKNKSELKKEYASLKESGPHKKGSAEYTKMKELMFAIRAKGNWDGK